MKMIVGKETPDTGDITIGQTVRIGYFGQEIDEEIMNSNQRVIDYIRDTAEYIDTPDGKITAARMLERFLFMGEDQYGYLGKLSGGERRRLYLCKVLMEAPNVLVLDEPTNDLDITTLQILEDYLDAFGGIVIVVSHDRYFLDRTVGRIFAFGDDGRLIQSEGGYTDYVNRFGTSVFDNDEKSKTDVKPSATATEKVDKTNWKAGQTKKLKFTYMEQKEYETIEEDIRLLEEKIESLEKEIPKHSTNFVKLNELMKEKEACEIALEEKMERWMYLEELAAKISEQ